MRLAVAVLACGQQAKLAPCVGVICLRLESDKPLGAAGYPRSDATSPWTAPEGHEANSTGDAFRVSDFSHEY